MNSLEEYAKDWKQIKSRHTSADKHFLNSKNQKIMNNIIKFENEERWENKWGIGLGLGGLLFAILFGIGFFGIGLPVYNTPLNFNGFIFCGITLMFLGILYMFINTRTERVKLDKLGENSQAYLITVKEKLKNSGKRKSFYGIIYVLLIAAGISFVYWGIFSQMSNGRNLFIYSSWMPCFFGTLGWALWRIRYNRKEKTKIQPLLKEIDNMLESID